MHGKLISLGYRKVDSIKSVDIYRKNHKDYGLKIYTDGTDIFDWNIDIESLGRNIYAHHQILNLQDAYDILESDLNYLRPAQ